MDQISRDDMTDMSRVDYQKAAELKETQKQAEMDYYLKTHKVGYIEDDRHNGYFWYTQRKSCFGDTPVLKMAKNYFFPEHPYNQCQLQLNMMALRFTLVVLFCPLTGETRLFIRAKTDSEAKKLASKFNSFTMGLTKKRLVVHQPPFAPLMDPSIVPVNLVDIYEENKDETFLGLFDSEDEVFYYWKPKAGDTPTKTKGGESESIPQYHSTEREDNDEFESHQIPDPPMDDTEEDHELRQFTET